MIKTDKESFEKATGDGVKRYWLFSGETYYALGGLNDLHMTSNDLDDLVDHAEEQALTSRFFDWWHILDTQENVVVAESEGAAYGSDKYWDGV